MEKLNRTVLLIEDDVRVVPGNRTALRDNDFEMVICDTAKSALAWLKQHRPVLMILEDSLPEMSGFEFLQRVEKETAAGVPPFILTGDAYDSRISLEAMTHGAQAYLVKDETLFMQLSVALKRTTMSVSARNETDNYYKTLFDEAPVPFWLEDFSGVKSFMDALRSSGITDFRKHFMEHADDVKHCASLIRVIDVNRESLKFFDIDTVDFWPSELNRIFNEDTWPVFREELVRLAEGSLRYESDISITKINGARRMLRLMLSVAPGFEASLGLVLISIIDVTDKYEQETRLREAATRYRVVADNTLDWEFWIDPHGRFIYSSPSCLTITGYRAEEFMEDAGLFFRIVHPEDSDRFSRHGSKVMKLPSRDDAVEEYRIIDKNGAVRWIGHICQPVYDNQGVFLGIRGSNRDITDRKRAEADRDREYAKLSALIESSEQPIFSVDRSYCYTAFNAVHAQVMKALFGKEIELGANILDYHLAPADRALAKSNLDRVFNGEVVYIEHAAGDDAFERRVFAIRHNPIRDKSGEVTGAAIFAQDLTEHLQAESALRDRDLRLEKLTRQIPGMLYQFMKKPDGTYCVPFATDAISSIFGCTPADVSNDFAPLAAAIHPEDYDFVMSSIVASAEHMTRFDCEYRIQTPGQPVRWLWGNSMPEKLADGSIIWHGYNMDITERKRVEEALRESEDRLLQVFDTNAAVKFVMDPRDGRILQANEAAAQFYGYPKGELLAKTIYDISCLPPDEVREELAKWAREDSRYGTFRHRLASGDIRDVEVYSSFFQSGGQTFLHLIVFDITERRKAEEALRTREEQYRALFDSMLEGCAYCQMIYDPNGEPQDWIYLDVNSSFGRLTGLTNVIGRRVSELIPTIKDLNPELFRIYGHVARTGKSTSFEVFFKPLGLWLQVNVVSPRPDHFLAVFEDVSARMLAVEALRESELRFKQVAENAEEWIWEVDADGLFRYTSPIVEKILGYKPEELVGKVYFWELFEPAIREELKAAVLNAFARRDSLHHLINPNLHKDGQMVILETNAVPIIDEQDVLIGYRGTDQDITARQRDTEALLESEERFRMLSNMAPVGIYRTDPQGKCVYVNDHWCEMAGLAPDEALGEGWHKALHPEDKSRIASAWQRMVDSEGQWGHEYRFKTPSGKITWVYGYAAPMRGPEGKVFGYVGCDADITQRKQAEDALRASEDRLREIIENQGEGIGIIGGDEAFLFANPAADEIFGVPRGTLIGRDLTEFLSSDELARIRQETERRKKGEKGNYELEICRPSGERRNIIVTATPRRNKLGHVIGTFGIFRDITERKQVEMSLLKSEDRYRELYEQSPLGYQSLDADGRFIVVNQAWLDALGYKEEEVIGRWFGDFLAPHLVDAFRERFPRFKQAGKIRTAFEMRRKDGKSVEMEFEGRIGYDPNGNFKQTHCILQDVTDQKIAEEKLRSSEERFRRIFEQGPFGMVIAFPPDYHFAAVNGAFCDFIGYSEQELLSLKFPEVTHPDHITADLEKVNQVVNGRLPYYTTEKRYIRKDGKVVWGQVTVTVIHDAAGAVAYMLAMIVDITERRLTEEKLKASEAQLRASQRMEAIGRLAGGVAHDFNNLLTVISGHSEITLRQLSDKDPLRADIEEIVKTSQRAGNLTRQLLAFSRRQAVSPIVLDINNIVANMLRMLKRIIGENIELETNYQSDLWHVKADPGQIEQVIVNLAVNARDAMPNGGVLSIETLNMVIEADIIHGHEVILTGQYALISVSDTGIGMSPDVQSRIFEPFFTTKPVGVGTGLGLATVYGIVKQSGGYIVVDSREEHGTTFNIYLPAATDDLPAMEVHMEQERRLSGSESIVLVDDNIAIHTLLARVLEQYGYCVTTAASAEEALERCRAMPQPADLLISDVVLPKMNGMDLAVALRKIWPSSKVLLMSGYTADVLPNEIADRGLILLQKPFGPMHLVSKVRDLLDAKIH